MEYMNKTNPVKESAKLEKQLREKIKRIRAEKKATTERHEMEVKTLRERHEVEVKTLRERLEAAKKASRERLEAEKRASRERLAAEKKVSRERLAAEKKRLHEEYEVRIAKAEEELKKKYAEGHICLQPIARHKFSEFIVGLSSELYVNLSCGFRGVVQVMSILQRHFKWDFDCVPSRNSIQNWIEKEGYSIYTEPVTEITKGNYAIIVDESMMFGGQKILMTVGVDAKKKEGCALGHGDADILKISVKSSWSGEEIKKDIAETKTKIGHDPDYAISDNASSMGKGIREAEIVRVRDVAHTFGTFAEHAYGKDEEFNGFMKQVTLVKFREVMTPNAWLLPPKQRTVARFMNLSGIAKWAVDLQNSFHRLSADERRVYSFVPRSASLVDELGETFDCLNTMLKDITKYGMSQKTYGRCEQYINCLKRAGSRPSGIASEAAEYIREESAKAGENCWNASTDLIESYYGVYKRRKCPNPLVGVTAFVLLLPVHTRLCKNENGQSRSVDFKKCLEDIKLSDIGKWRREKLPENMVAKRIKMLKMQMVADLHKS
jgi:hypothetical protein